jgi:exodeoxyribonuclease VII large subunit
MKPEIPVLTVSQLNLKVRSWLENEIGEVQILGELSNFSKPSSGHFYFTLKDQHAQIRCVFFRNHHTKESNLLIDGQQVTARGRLSLYEARGDYQLIVFELIESGMGALYQQFMQIKEKLANAGLFEEQRKRSLPKFPSTIGVITSATGAALQDILSTLSRRFILADIYIYPCEVQGATAASQLINALKQANLDNRVQVLILARGGGSIEDLWPFNNESLAYAISESKIPVVTGVGHETDFTIADFVADHRAATPTAAAEAVTPDAQEILAAINILNLRMQRAIKRYLEHRSLLVTHTLSRLLSPQRIILNQSQTIDFLESQLHQCMRQQLHRKIYASQFLYQRLENRNPVLLIKNFQTKLHFLNQQLNKLAQAKLNKAKLSFAHYISTLKAVSPLSTLERGYSITQHNNHIVYDSAQIKIEDVLKVTLAKGELLCEVLEIR